MNERFAQARIKANDPTRPTSMLAIINHLPVMESVSVIPDEIPRLVNAELTSSNRSSEECPCSVIAKIKVPAKIHKALMAIMVKALKTWSVAIERPPIWAFVLPDMMALIAAIKIAKLVIFTPLPVDPGEDPIKPKSIMIITVAMVALPTGTNKKPALRNEIELNSNVTILSIGPMPASVLFCSAKNNKIMPNKVIASDP